MARLVRRASADATRGAGRKLVARYRAGRSVVLVRRVGGVPLVELGAQRRVVGVEAQHPDVVVAGDRFSFRLDSGTLISDAVASPLYTNFLKAIEEMKAQHFELESKIVVGAWFEVHAYPAATGLTVYLRDITERKRSEEELRFRARLLNTVEQGVIATNLEGNIIYWNAFAEQLYGWSAAEALGANIFDLIVPKASEDVAAQIFSQMKSGGSWSGEFPVQRRDGTVFFPSRQPIRPSSTTKTN